VRYLGLILSLPLYCVRVVLFLVVSALGMMLAGVDFALGRRRAPEAADRPVKRAETGVDDDDDDPDRRRWKRDLRDHENYARMGKAMDENAHEPSVPRSVWEAQRRIRRA
jgi:hypothetical protein